MTIETLTIQFINHSVAVVEVIHIIRNYELPKGVKHENERQIKTYIAVKQKENRF